MTPNPLDAPPHRPARRWATVVAGVAVAATTLVVVSASNVATASSPSDDDWLGVVNTYRAQSGLPAVSDNPAWAAGTRNHSCWMLLNGIAHDETPGTPGYTSDGDQAGNSGNVAVSSNASATARSHIDLWMSGPFHAISAERVMVSPEAHCVRAAASSVASATVWESVAPAGLESDIRRNRTTADSFIRSLFFCRQWTFGKATNRSSS